LQSLSNNNDKKIPAHCGDFFRSDDQNELHHAYQ